ncbi:MAG: MAE_28990/MAE_18760 family HEPN-like nuclease [Anaerolineae bacterium]
MKIRTVEQLFDFTSNELAWRRKELSDLKAMASSSNLSPSKRNALLRSMVTLTYAHWEGFVKNCAGAYVQYVAMQRMNHNELSMNFVALALRSLLAAASQSRQSIDHIKVVEFFQTRMSTQSSLPYKDAIDTEANLSSRVLHNIVTVIGLDYSVYSTKEKLLDDRLLKSRNSIAHGDQLTLSYDEVMELHEIFLELMQLFGNQIDNAAATQQYRAQ